MVDGVTLGIAVGAGVISALFAVALMQRLTQPDRPPAAARGAIAPLEPISLLFRDRRLVDATSTARMLLDSLPGDGDWPKLWTWLAQRFDAPQQLLDRAATEGRAALTSGGGVSGPALGVEDLGHGLVRIHLTDPDAGHAGIVVNSHSLAAMEDEIAVLRESVDHAPVLIWREDTAGNVIWANGAYMKEVEAQFGDETHWPLPRLVDFSPGGSSVPRAELRTADQQRWFDCHLQPGEDHLTVFAVPADNAVRAERSLRDFVQTLSKTFADLPIGLAIFDRERRLQLFNPALIDLTGLNVGFLTGRPPLYALLDGLRELRMVPEPKDYPSWRNRMATLEAEAASGRHVETWTLPGGQTYRVTGQPHADGAIALLFEDISDTITLSRRFRSELSLGAEILDGIDTAVAVFDADGRVVTANRAFDAAWGAGAATSLRGYVEHWRRAASDSPGFQSLRRAIAPGRGAEPAQGAIAGSDDALLSWSVRSLSGGQRMVQFARAMSADRPGSPAAVSPLPAVSGSAAGQAETAEGTVASGGKRRKSGAAATEKPQQAAG